MMKRVVAATLLAAATVPAFAQNVGVSVSIGQPGFYGQIDIGDAPPPQLVYAQPVVIQPAVIAAAPIYLHVPPGHAKHWRKHCAEYDACGRPVYFVRDDWYDRTYVPYYRERHGGPRGDWDDDRDHGPRDHDDDHGRGHGHGHGHGHDHDRED